MANEEHLLSFINKIAVEQSFNVFEVKITPVSSCGANYSSKLYRVKISEKARDDLELFAKVAVLSEKMREQTCLKPYDNEQLAYTVLLKTYRHLEEKHNVVEENKLKFPKYYGTDMTYLQEILVLEDLTSKGFQPANRFQSVNWQYASAAVTELAKFHALSMAYQHEYQSDFDQFFKKCSLGVFPENKETDLFFNQSVDSALEAVREENRASLSNFFKDKTTEVIPIDYQTIQGGSPVFDLLYFIFTATDREFRTKHYQNVLLHYHTELGIALARLGLNVDDKYSWKDFEFELKEKLSFGLLVSVMMLPILTISEDQAPSLDNSLDMTTVSVKTSSHLYSQRLNDVVDDYVQWGVLK